MLGVLGVIFVIAVPLVAWYALWLDTEFWQGRKEKRSNKHATSLLDSPLVRAHVGIRQSAIDAETSEMLMGSMEALLSSEVLCS